MSILGTLPAEVIDFGVAGNPGDKQCEFYENWGRCSRQALFRFVLARKECSCGPLEWSRVACIPHKEYTLAISWTCVYCPAPVEIVRVERV